MPRLKNYRLTNPGRLLGVILSSIAACVFLAWFVPYTVTQTQINAQMGFSYGTPWRGGWLVGEEVFLITRIVPGKPMHRAGLRRGDRLLLHSTEILYRSILDNQGRSMPLPVERDGERLAIRVQVPRLRLTWRKG